MMFTTCPFQRGGWQHLSFVEIVFSSSTIFSPLLSLSVKTGVTKPLKHLRNKIMEIILSEVYTGIRDTFLKIPTKSVTVLLEIMSVWVHTQQPGKKVFHQDCFLPANLYSNFFALQRQTPLKSSSLFVSHTFFQLQFCLQQNSLTYLSFLNPFWSVQEVTHAAPEKGVCCLTG